ncbi:MAG: BamA/TamA family outer membrane protein, partial [Syntrophothermus sp.]
MKFRFLIFIFIIIYCSTEARQTDLTPTVPADTAESFIQADSIQVFGNEKTNDLIILRELTFRQGDKVRYADLNYNRERIYSLGLFTDVQIIPDAGRNRIIIAVEESWYFWPIPFVNLKDNSLDRATYGMNVSYKNFRGMNETITASVGMGYDPYAAVEYISPWFIKERNISLSASLAYMKIYNKNSQAEQLAGGPFSQKVISGGVTLGKRLDIFNVIGISAGFDYLESPKEVLGLNAEKGRFDRILKAGVLYNYDSRNLKQFPDSGLYFYASAMQKGFGIKDVNYTLLSADYRQYVPIIGGLSVKWRLATKFVLGENIPF